MAYTDFVRLVIEVLEAAGVAYLVGGAVAAWAWGEPRATMDLDLDELDYRYIEQWVDRKGLNTLWIELLARIRSQS